MRADDLAHPPDVFLRLLEGDRCRQRGANPEIAFFQGRHELRAEQWKKQKAGEHREWEEFSRLRLSQGADLRKYYPLRDDARAEYEEWRRTQPSASSRN